MIEPGAAVGGGARWDYAPPTAGGPVCHPWTTPQERPLSYDSCPAPRREKPAPLPNSATSSAANRRATKTRLAAERAGESRPRGVCARGARLGRGRGDRAPTAVQALRQAAGHRDDGAFAPQARRQALEDRGQARIARAAHRGPRALQQQCAQRRGPTFENVPAPIELARTVLPRRQAQVAS